MCNVYLTIRIFNANGGHQIFKFAPLGDKVSKDDFEGVALQLMLPNSVLALVNNRAKLFS